MMTIGFKLKFKQALNQVRLSWKDALCAGLAAGLAWFISVHFLDHEHPIYAAMTALICLAPGVPSHGRQAIYVLIGVLTGVAVGELTLLLPPMPTEVRIVIVGFAGMTIASAYSIVPAIIIQAGISAVMVFALGADVAGWTRAIDVAVGTSIGLIFSQILFTPDPLKTLHLAVERFFKEVALNFTLAADALERNDVSDAIKAMKSCSRTHSALIGLIGAIDVARSNARWTLRGRLSSREVVSLSARYDQSGIRLYASSLLFCEAMVNAIRKGREAPPEWLIEALKLIVENCHFIAGEAKLGQEFVFPDRSGRAEASLTWRECVIDIEMVETTLARFYKSRTRRNRLAAYRKKQILDAVREQIAERKRAEALLADEEKDKKL
ncbi:MULTISPECIES: aromatic acid exporter family protein [Bartonella]|uniref:FUSC family protein n=1 Tax=Bartonella TaxID=773 RepID=UPI0018DDD6B4|nr:MULTISPECIES: FUSC family protein [Bartonella]MBH9994881.1 aromatic acid exporter family protein [Bartonella sp. P0291]MBH9996774.1 aromatic acid exporter family protein [Bartonella sp. M0192]MBH9998934.1 aromatic acid exporter family protein [Bartonella sp. M0191]MBI0007313.1 aromatic acid exporter family protein [Bartonella sp. M0193]MBI0010225.1 aromatic acid exporter family protein [Bartonella sp. M0176]